MDAYLHGFHDLYKELSDKLDSLEKEFDGAMAIAEASIPICQHYIELLKKRVLENGFPDENAEIRFFKFTKPRFVCLYIYYVEIIKFHQHLPPEYTEAMVDY